MIVAVTGATGFIGTNLVSRLLGEGHEVHCLVRPAASPTPRGARRHIVRYEDQRSLLSCDALAAADVVFHLAGATKALRPDAFREANVVPTRNLLGALTARRSTPRFVYVSSQAAAGPAFRVSQPVLEDDPPAPVEPYGRSKLEAERVVRTFLDHVPWVIVRPSAVFGPHDRDFLPLFRLAERGVVLYPGTRDHWLSLVHVGDVIEAMLLAARTDHAIGRTYFVSAPSPVQWRTLGEHIAAAVGRRARHVDVSARVIRTASVAGDLLARFTGTATLASSNKAALSLHPYWVCSVERAREELGFRATDSLPAQVRDTYNWYREHGWLRGSRRVDDTAARPQQSFEP